MNENWHKLRYIDKYRDWIMNGQTAETYDMKRNELWESFKRVPYMPSGTERQSIWQKEYLDSCKTSLALLRNPYI